MGTRMKQPRAFLQTVGTSGRPVLAVVCSRCGAREVGSDKTFCPPEIVAKHFTSRGWRIVRDGASATCPACQAATGPKVETDVAAELQRQREREQRRIAAEDTMPTTDRSRDTIRAQARLHSLLSEHFSVEGDAGTYDEGWSDDRVSAECGLARAEVVRVREAAYGCLVDPRFAAVERRIAETRRRHEDDMKTLREMCDALEQQARARISELEAALAGLR